jgi:hypothetical protein
MHKFSNCDFDYTLTGVIVHQGSAEQGHSVTIVQGDDKEWYVCDDQQIEYFDLDQLPAWAFGLADEATVVPDDVSTGCLLFYTRKGMGEIGVLIPPDFERKLNRENARAWARTIFFSPLFVVFAKQIVIENLENAVAVEIGLQVFFKIVVTDGGAKQDSEVVTEWAELLTRRVLTTDRRCDIFVNFLDAAIGDSLGNLFMISNRIAAVIPELLVHVVKNQAASSRPARVILKHLKHVMHKRQVVVFVYDMIHSAPTELKVDDIRIGYYSPFNAMMDESDSVLITFDILTTKFALTVGSKKSVSSQRRGLSAAL